MPEQRSTLTAEFKSKDPYSYLACVEGYQLPQEWVDNMQVPELHSTRILRHDHLSDDATADGQADLCDAKCS